MCNTKILIVDDEPLTCQLISKVLYLNGYEAAILTDSREIESSVQREKPQLILLDYHLGVQQGIEVLHTLKTNPVLADIPVVVTSGIDHRKKVLEVGADGFLQKPFDWKELVTVLHSLLPDPRIMAKQTSVG